MGKFFVLVIIVYVYKFPKECPNVLHPHMAAAATGQADQFNFSAVTGAASLFSFLLLANAELLFPLWPLEL